MCPGSMARRRWVSLVCSSWAGRMGPMSSRPMLTQREAATACGVSHTTTRRRREAGDLPGAVHNPVRG